MIEIFIFRLNQSSRIGPNYNSGMNIIKFMLSWTEIGNIVNHDKILLKSSYENGTIIY